MATKLAIVNPNGTLNVSLTTRAFIRAQCGLPVEGSINVVSDAMMHHLCNQEELYENDCILVMREFNRIMSEAKKQGSAFYIGKGYYDVTVMVGLWFVGTLTSVAEYHEAHQEAEKSETVRKQITLRETWNVLYAGIVGLANR